MMWNIGRIELNCHLGRKHELELEEYVFFNRLSRQECSANLKVQLLSILVMI